MKNLCVSFAFLFIVLLEGCTGVAMVGDCNSNEDCNNSQICYAQQCHSSCNKSSDCLTGERCVNGVCLESELLDATVDVDHSPDGNADLDTMNPQDISTADVDNSDAGLFDSLRSDSALPDAAASDTALPDAAVSDVAVSDTALPDTALPDTALPDTALPDVAAAGTYGGPCLQNGTCNGDLLCYHGFCKNDHTVWPGLIIDSHVHFDKSDLSQGAALVNAMNSLGVDKAVTFPGCPNDHGGPEGDDAVWSLATQYPEKFWPCLGAFDASASSSVTYVREQLNQRAWRCMGEIYLRQSPGNVQIPANHPVMMQIYQMAEEHGIPVFIHFEPDFGTSNADQGLAELANALQSYPSLPFVWLHGCNGYSSMVEHYDNLTCSMDGSQDVYEEDAIGVGSDIGCASMLTAPDGTSYQDYIDNIRQKLLDMDADLAEDIRYQRIWQLMEEPW